MEVSLEKGVVQPSIDPPAGGDDPQAQAPVDEHQDEYFNENDVGGDFAHTLSMAKELYGILPDVRNDYAPKVKEHLNQIGDFPIALMRIFRTPINSVLKGVVDTISLKALPDTLYHLFMVLDIDVERKIHQYKLEKNHIIEFGPLKNIPTPNENMTIIFPHTLNVDTLLQNTRSLMGDKFFPYDAFQNNCQDFILSILKANNLLQYNPTAEAFIKQSINTKDPRIGWTSKVSNFVTDLAGKFDHLIYGGSVYAQKPSNLESTDDLVVAPKLEKV